jgi:hypothetical protein
MAKKLDETLIEILTKYEEDPKQALWDCHGTWVAYHKAIERIAAKAGVVFDMPQIIEANSEKKTVAIAVRGIMGDRSEWSFGEATPSNNKNAYPYAMAEKRAKDRVVLKLVGLHGLVYSEEESDTFKEDMPAEKPVSSASLKKPDENGKTAWNRLEDDLDNDMADCHTLVALNAIKDVYRARARKENWPAAWMSALKDRFESEENRIKAAMETDTFPGDKPNTYANAVMAG